MGTCPPLDMYEEMSSLSTKAVNLGNVRVGEILRTRTFLEHEAPTPTFQGAGGGAERQTVPPLLHKPRPVPCLPASELMMGAERGTSSNGKGDWHFKVN